MKPSPFHLPVQCPATCELCGYWMPRHDYNCPRHGVHPSQWSEIIFDHKKSNMEHQNHFTGTGTGTLPTTCEMNSKPSLLWFIY
ncbi:hypothetical protein J3Q64DRAFT_1713289 [Phycomyces blakesleeanus]|uniref:Uncharacterized protein n=1 Tax=Phycomyces blakesleeanus TaxID=4837 RepID=A0ABR3BF63_PHYBL